MDLDTDPQNSVQTPPQQQAQADPPPNHTSPATVSEDTGTHHPPPASDADDVAARALKRVRKHELCILSKRFGHIPNVPIFTEWNKRTDCSDSAVHRPHMAGICGNRKDGAFSVALSSLYEDDEDGGDVIIYTGAGGRKPRTEDIKVPYRRPRFSPQTEDQSWDHSPNRALMISLYTGKPVRVIRSWKCPSQYAPLQGYRYDGLYKVAACWTAKGKKGLNICRCRLERLPGQPLIPLRPITSSALRRWPRERLVSRVTPSPSTCTSPFDITDETDVDTEPTQSNSSRAQLAESRLPSPPQQQAMSEASTGIDFNTGEVDPDVKDLQPPSRQRASPKPGVLPRYRWDPKKNELVKLLASHIVQEGLEVAGGDEEEHRGEDDATLVPSEDGHLNERMETEYFSDMDTSP
ncbi:PUA-like domain-containing protein [Lanmaoa asiatica]|nr:PUA-like domain-containing protein [Lanmaoa asiatica]